jgi:glycerol-3-phosphate dehydrogenase
MIRLGLFFYDHLYHRKLLLGSQAIDLQKHSAGLTLKSSFRQAFIYSDCHGDDARLVIANLLAAQKHGATLMPRHCFQGAQRSQSIWKISLLDVRSNRSFKVTSNALVNTAGPWVVDVARSIVGITVDRRLRMVRGSHIVVPRQWEGEHGYFLQTRDRRFILAFPFEKDFTLIGTTDEPCEEAPGKAAISDKEIEYMLAEVNAYLRKPVTRDDIV